MNTRGSTFLIWSNSLSRLPANKRSLKMMDARRKKRAAGYAAALVLSILTFTPVIIPKGVYEPMLLGMPRTLWTGILLTILLVFITYVVGRYAPDDADALASSRTDLQEPS